MRKYYNCECHNEVLVVERDKDDREDRQFNIAIYTQCKPEKHWKNRLRYIWRIIREGTPYGDCVILSNTMAKELADDILAELQA